MAKEKRKTPEQTELSSEEKLRILYELQQIDSKIDGIKILCGELPLEVQDLEDEIMGLETRITNLHSEAKELEDLVAKKKVDILNAEALIDKYEEQQKNVRNNREFDSLSKEIEYQTLDIELSEKKIKEFTFQNKEKKQTIEQSEQLLADRKSDLSSKQQELSGIIAETQKEEQDHAKKSKAYQEMIEPRLLSAYKRIRANARNGLAVVVVRRDACGGCFNKIPPQRQLDIKMRKKIIVCEYCGRILVDQGFDSES